MAQTVKHLSTMQETRVRSLGREDSLEKEMAMHSSTIAWKSHGQRSLVGYGPWGHKESDTTERLHLLTDLLMKVGARSRSSFKSFTYLEVTNPLHLSHSIVISSC